MTDFIQDVMDATIEAETPRSFVFWSILSSISAVTSHKVFYNKGGHYKLKPNIYVMLIGRSGLKKGYAIDLAKRLVFGVGNTRMISGRNTIQSIVTEMSKAITQESGTVIADGRAFLLANELATLLQEDPQAQKILTDIYDSHSYDEVPWVNSTKSGPKEVIKQPCVTLLGASNEDLLNSFLDKTSIKGGLIGRTFIVREKKKSRNSDLIDDVEQLNIQPYIDRLKELSNVEGKFVLEADAKVRYKEFKAGLDSKFETFEDKTGYYERLNDHVLRVGMLLSIGRGNKNTIPIDCIEHAIEACTVFAGQYKNLFGGMGGKSDIGSMCALFLEELRNSPNQTMSHRSMLRRNYSDFDNEELSKIAHTTIQMGMVKVVETSEGSGYKIVEDFSKEIDLLLTKK